MICICININESGFVFVFPEFTLPRRVLWSPNVNPFSFISYLWSSAIVSEFISFECEGVHRHACIVQRHAPPGWSISLLSLHTKSQQTISVWPLWFVHFYDWNWQQFRGLACFCQCPLTPKTQDGWQWQHYEELKLTAAPWSCCNVAITFQLEYVKACRGGFDALLVVDAVDPWEDLNGWKWNSSGEDYK